MPPSLFWGISVPSLFWGISVSFCWSSKCLPHVNLAFPVRPLGIFVPYPNHLMWCTSSVAPAKKALSLLLRLPPLRSSSLPQPKSAGHNAWHPLSPPPSNMLFCLTQLNHNALRNTQQKGGRESTLNVMSRDKTAQGIYFHGLSFKLCDSIAIVYPANELSSRS
jgi:hypothetical protein